jgi:hypothetical protein
MGCLWPYVDVAVSSPVGVLCGVQCHNWMAGQPSVAVA